MKKQTNTKKHSKLLALFYKYWLSIVLLIVLITLIRQNFIINKFPISLSNKQANINQSIRENEALQEQNKIKLIELKAQTASDKEVLESQARYRFGLIKEGDTYYQINSSNK